MSSFNFIQYDWLADFLRKEYNSEEALLYDGFLSRLAKALHTDNPDGFDPHKFIGHILYNPPKE